MHDAAPAGSPRYPRGPAAPGAGASNPAQDTSVPEHSPSPTSTRAQDATRDRQAQERVSLLGDYQRDLAEAAPADHESLHQRFVQDWTRMAERHGAGSAGLRILAYCTEWDPHKGGIVAVNRNLVEGLAAAGHEVFVRVGHAVAPDAAGERIHLIGPRQHDPARGSEEQLRYDGEDLPFDIDVIIGHSRYSGPDAARTRDERYPDTPYVHVVHMATAALGRLARRPDLEVESEGVERRMVAAADLVAGVGPALEEEAGQLAATTPGDHVPAVHRIDPGVPFEEPPALPVVERRTRNVLFIGRADAQQKGVHEAARMVRNLAEEGADVRLTVRGASPQDAERVAQGLSRIAGRKVEVKPFSIDRGEILADMREADVLVMPSRAEGFGLVALEAAGAGLPVLVPSTSGAGRLLSDTSRFPPEVTRANVVEQGFEDSVDVQRWTSGLRGLLQDMPTARQNALTLRTLLSEADTTWTSAARSLAAAVRAVPHRNAPQPQAPEIPAIPGHGWVHCARGHAHEGQFGAAGLLPVHRAADGEVYALMGRRRAESGQDEVWGPLEGVRSGQETAAEAALRGAADRGFDRASVRVERVVRDDHGGWSYDTVIASADQRIPIRTPEGESSAATWVPVSEIPGLKLDPAFAANWPRVRSGLGAALDGDRPTGGNAAAAIRSASAPGLPPHPVSGALVVSREALELGGGAVNRELATFDDGTRAVYEKYAQTQDARAKVLDTHVGRAVGARLPLAYPVGLREVYTDHMPGEAAATRPQDPAEAARQEAPGTRDGALLGLHHALTASRGVTVGQRENLIWAGSGTAPRGSSPDTDNPFVRAYYRQVEPGVSAWVDNPLPPGDTAVIGQRLGELRPLFENFGRPDLHNALMERFGQIAEHATGTDPLLPRAPVRRATPAGPAAGPHSAPPPAAGSQELADQQQMAEALMTDGGRITDTSDAKTVAIATLARRMRSSTPALVLAALSKTVGTDMGERLGDGRYVLAPHHSVYLSIGADVVHIDELDPDNPRHALGTALRMDDPRAETLVRQITVSEIVEAWAYGSNNNARVLALQEATKEEFGLAGTLEWRMDRATRHSVDMELAYNRDTLRDFVRTQYEITQELLESRGISEVIAYRAMTWAPEGAQPPWEGLEAGDDYETRHRPLASWTADRRIAADWLERRGGRAVILVDRKPARDVLAVPLTGIGYLRQREWVTLPGERAATLDRVYAGVEVDRSKTRGAAAGVNLGAPDIGGATEDPAVEGAETGGGGGWQPAGITAAPEPGNALDNRIMRILDGQEPVPSWWLQDDSGYAVTKRDLEFLGISPTQVRWMLSGEAPLGMTPETYQRFGAEMLVALGRDGAKPSQVDVRLKGTGSAFFAGLHKTLPREEDLADYPEAAGRLREWFGEGGNRPLRRPYDAMWRLGLEAEPSDVDLDINSGSLVQAAREHWKTHSAERYSGEFMGGHGYLDKGTVKEALPALAAWAHRWEEKLGRPISLGVFEGSGPIDATVLGRQLSSHKRGSDWVIHKPDTPMAWLTPERNSRGAALGGSDPTSTVALAARANPGSARGSLGRSGTKARSGAGPSREGQGQNAPER